MSVFTIEIQAGDPSGQRFVPVRALVDTGASYTTLPAEMLRELGVAPDRKQNFVLASGQRMSREVGQTKVRVDGEEVTTVVVFGDANMTPLLGAVTLEEMGLGVEPLGHRLIAIDGYMM